MRVAVFSDSHGNPAAMASVVYGMASRGELPDALIHLGDGIDGLEAAAEHYSIPFYAVLGNCDFSLRLREKYKRELLIELGGAKLLLVHGLWHGVMPGTTYEARQRALKLGADALLYGHTHMPECAMKDGILVLNPGSISQPRGGSSRSYALLEIENGTIRPRIVPVKQAL